MYATGDKEKEIHNSIKLHNNQGDGYYTGTKKQCDTIKGKRNERVRDRVMNNNFPVTPYTKKRKTNSRDDNLKVVTELLRGSYVLDDDDDDDDERNKKKRRLPASPNRATVPVATTNVINPAATTNVTNPTGELSLFCVGGVPRTNQNDMGDINIVRSKSTIGESKREKDDITSTMKKVSTVNDNATTSTTTTSHKQQSPSKKRAICELDTSRGFTDLKITGRNEQGLSTRHRRKLPSNRVNNS